MLLAGKTKLFDLIEKYPFLVDFLSEFNPLYTGLHNPVLRNTIGRMASLRQVAQVGKTPLIELLTALQQAIKSGNGDEVAIELHSELEDGERQALLKQLIRDLHAGYDQEEIKQRFTELIEDVSPGEIAAMEQTLVAEGMPAEEIRRLCDVHVQVMQPALDLQDSPAAPPGHPVHTFMAENREFEWRAKRLDMLLDSLGAPPDEVHFVLVRDELTQLVGELAQVELHYQRKEHQLFPYLEQHGVTAPPKVMWAIHDELRAKIKEVQRALRMTDLPVLAIQGQQLTTDVQAMIYKEEHILYPMALELLTADEWRDIFAGEREIGYALVEPEAEWLPAKEGVSATVHAGAQAGILQVETGALTLEQLNLIITHLPIEMSFVDEHDEVRFYSNTPHRIFPRSPAVIGRKVQNCHPASSLHMVERIIAAFRKGEKDIAEFWIPFNEMYVHIRYFAVRNTDGAYRGTLEVVQDISELQQLNGEQRLLDWGDE